MKNFPPAPRQTMKPVSKRKKNENKKIPLSLKSQVSWLFDVQIPALLSEIREKDREISNLMEENVRLNNEMRTLKENVQSSKSVEPISDEQLSRMEIEIDKLHGALTVENVEMNSEIQALKANLQSLNSVESVSDGQWATIEIEMNNLHNTQHIYPEDEATQQKTIDEMDTLHYNGWVYIK